jgi:hypothetical protein
MFEKQHLLSIFKPPAERDETKMGGHASQRRNLALCSKASNISLKVVGASKVKPTTSTDIDIDPPKQVKLLVVKY